MSAPVREGTQLRRSLSVWQAVGLSVALMAPSMAANINPQGTAGPQHVAFPPEPATDLELPESAEVAS